MLYRIQSFLLTFFLLFLSQALMAATIALDTIGLQSSEQDNIQVVLRFSEAVNIPQHFSMENPPTIAFDFQNVKNKVSRDVLQKISASAVLENVDILETQHKTRVVLNLKKMVSFDLKINKNEVFINLNAKNSRGKMSSVDSLRSMDPYQIKSFDFRRGDNGEGRLIVSLSNPKAAVDVIEALNQTTLSFMGAGIQDSLLKKYDVVDFATPIRSVEISRGDGVVNFRVLTNGDYNKMVYQIDNQFVMEARPKKTEDNKNFDQINGGYSGNKISLNFQNIDIRSILQVIADFSKFNMIASDSVKGNITLRLQNVPWDQALDIILKSKGLDKRQNGNVMMIGSSEELASREKSELENQKQAQELGVLKSELIQVNYAQADDIATMLKDKTNSLLTSRGTVTVDKRTNTLLVQDLESKLAEVRDLLKKLDIPVRQVEIDTQIVEVNADTEHTLGMRFGGGANAGFGHRKLGIGSQVEKARAIADAGKMPSSQATTDLTGAGPVSSTAGAGLADGTLPQLMNSEGLFSDLGAKALTSGSNVATMGLALARLPNGTLLDLELQALDFENTAKTLARPKLVTMDQKKASVSKGTQIPYLSSSSSGAATVSYQSAVLKLDVTPHITADNRISLDLDISNDSAGTAVTGSTGGVPINTTAIQTQVLVDNGATIVLGGILQVKDNKTQAKVPFFGSLPIIGGLFRNKYTQYNPDELCIFITPRIINILKNNG